jgi:glyoxylase-like metal-dependent hydrolase (beta-lactamase superfamily II)
MSQPSITALARLHCLAAAILLSGAPAAGPAGQASSAGDVLRAAVDALGGSARLAALDDWVVEGRGRENSTAEMQGVDAEAPTWRVHEERVAVRVAARAVAWERKTPRNDMSLRWRRFIYTAEGTGVVDRVSGRGSMNTTPAAPERRDSLMRRVPHVLLRQAAQGGSARLLPGRTLGGRPVDVVQVSFGGRPVTLAIGRDPAVLRRVEYPLHLPGRGDVLVGWQFDGWQRDAALGWKPAGHAVDVDGTPFQEVRYSTYGAGAADAADMMRVPAGLQPMQGGGAAIAAARGIPASGQVAPGVHLLDVHGFNVLVVEFRDFVVAVDAPEAHPGLEAIPAGNADPARAVARDHLAQIRERFPGKPLQSVVVTHHHSDHLGGVRTFAAAGARIVVAPAHRRAVEEALGRPHTIRPDGWTGRPADASLETVADRRLVTDGTRRLEILNVGQNPHTTANLFVWLPEERIAFQGDLFYFDEHAPFPPSGRAIMNRFFAGWLARRGIEPRAVFGVHNDGAAGPEALARALEGAPPDRIGR